MTRRLDASDPANLTRTQVARAWTDLPTAGSLWDASLGSDWPARDLGLTLLDGIEVAEPAVVTPVIESSLPVGGGYQRPRISRVEVGGRTLWLAERGYGEGYLHFLVTSQEAAVEAMPIGCSWAAAG